MSITHWILTNGDITPTCLLVFGSWSSIMVGCTGLTGCIISLKDMTTHLSQSASPRADPSGSSQLKRHESDVPCQINISVIVHGWANDAVTTDMVRSLVECSGTANCLGTLLQCRVWMQASEWSTNSMCLL